MVSIITLHLKRERETLRFVESLYAHTRQPFELVIVSQDQSEETRFFLERLGKGRRNLHLLWNETNIGTAAGRNQGLRAATTNLAAVIDNDVELTDGWLPPLLESLERDQSIGAVGAMVLTPQGRPQYCSHYVVERHDSDGKRALGLHFDRWFESADPTINLECEVPWYPTTCLLVRRSSWEDIRGFDEQFEIAEEDKDFSLALRSAGFRLTYNPLSRVIHHGYPRDPEYAKIRENLFLLHRDRKRLEEKWSCDVINETSRRFLAESGFSQEQIARYERLSVFIKITN